MLRRLRVSGYKSLRDCEFRLQPITVVFGPNGAGKSNLLDLLGLLSALVSRDSIGDAFAEHRGRPLEAFHSPKGLSPVGIQDLLSREKVSLRVECDIEMHPRVVEAINDSLKERESTEGAERPYTRVTERHLRYTLEISARPKTGEMHVSDESLVALTADGVPKAGRKPFLEAGMVGGRRRFTARVERQSHPRYFDGMRTRTLLSELSDPVYHPHVVAAAREIAAWRVYYIEPTRMRGENPIQGAPEPGRHGQWLAAYYYFLQGKQPATLRSIVRNLQDLVVGIRDLRVDARGEGLLEIVATQTGGAEFPARVLSDGTLRLLCLLGIVVAPSPPPLVVYEEPENGVNPARLDRIAWFLRNAALQRKDGMQFLVTTHSPLVCELLPDALVRCAWDIDHGTRFDPFPWKPDTVFFSAHLRAAIDGSAPISRVAEGPAPGVSR